jgi:hypothetical protein
LPGDGPGVAVLVDPTGRGEVLRVATDTAEWRSYSAEGVWRGRRVQRGSLPSRGWIRARTRVEVDGEATRILSRAWPETRPEPERWIVRLERKDADRPRRGSVGVVLGGRQRGTGYHRWDELEVRTLDGTLLLREGFDDPERFRSEWLNPAGPPGGFDATILLVHSPAELMGRKALPFLDLVLAGHTHGGQAWFPPFGPVAMDPQIPAGWISGKTRIPHLHRWLYVTRGIGTSGFPLRLFCPPELTDLTFRVVPRSPPDAESGH